MTTNSARSGAVARAEDIPRDTTGTSSALIENVTKLGLLALQLALLALVIRQFQLVNSAFLRVALLAFGGFFIHHLLPQRHRMPFFLLLSVASIVLIFGPVSGAWLVAISCMLVGACYLPVPFAARVSVVVGIACLLAIFRVGWFSVPWTASIWPVLGSMFMFRLVIYLYDTREDSHREPLVRSLSYFLMIPNVCFPMFPVVDYTRFRRNYFDDDAFKIYQTGVRWMIRGVLHLIAYRVVYYYATIDPSEVTNSVDLVRYLIATFLLYLQVSGQFHLIIGMLHLFGFNLPETNHLYLLASSFNDFWRRINIYWKDFMVKVFYYPVYFKLRKIGEKRALVLSTFLVFIATWILHSYQWFWLRGTFPIIWQDGVYWMVLAALVAANSLYEMRSGKKKSRAASGSVIVRQLLLGIRILITMSIMLILWSLWMTESLGSWLALWAVL